VPLIPAEFRSPKMGIVCENQTPAIVWASYMYMIIFRPSTGATLNFRPPTGTTLTDATF
jgi:hypothetical protein